MKPLNKNVLVERIAGSKETSSGIILKTSLESDTAKVLEVGSQVNTVSIGDIVYLNWNHATKVDDEKYIIEEKEIVFIYEQ